MLTYTNTQFIDAPTSITNLPPALKWFLGDCHFSENTSQQYLPQMLIDGDLILTTDGSYHGSKNDGSYVMYCDLIHLHMWYGGRKLHSDVYMSSQRSEHYRVISILIVQLAITTCADKTIYTLPPLQLWIDNANTVTLTNTIPAIDSSISTYLSPDFDLWQLTSFLKPFIPMTISAKWIKSHQDHNTPTNELPLPVQANIFADQVASKLYTHNTSIGQLPPHENNGLYLSHNGHFIADIERQIKQHIHSREFMIYVSHKYK